MCNIKCKFLVLLIVIAAPVFGSCSNSVDDLYYNGIDYVLLSENDFWFPEPSSEELIEIGRTAFFPIRASSYDPVLVTNETSPNFMIVNLAGKKESNKEQAVAFIRSDITLSSVYDTAFDTLYFIFNRYNGIETQAVESSYFPSGTVFFDIVGDEPIMAKDLPSQWEYICEIKGSYPGIDYLFCTFIILKANDEYYLHLDNTETYYLLPEETTVAIMELATS